MLHRGEAQQQLFEYDTKKMSRRRFIAIVFSARRRRRQDCLKLYTSNDEVDKWQCPKCKDLRKATKKLDITMLPPLLVVHFKR